MARGGRDLFGRQSLWRWRLLLDDFHGVALVYQEMRNELYFALSVAFAISTPAAFGQTLRVEIVTFAAPNAEPEVTDEILAQLLASGKVDGVTLLNAFEVQLDTASVAVSRELSVGENKILFFGFRVETGADHRTAEVREIRLSIKGGSAAEATPRSSETRVAFTGLPVVELIHLEAGSAVTRHYGLRLTLEGLNRQ
jgi:hypothetical protein